MTTGYRALEFATVIAETEKAVRLEITVEWNQKYHLKSFWFPKSVLQFTEGVYEVKEWFAAKLERQNEFNGYPMSISTDFFLTK